MLFYHAFVFLISVAHFAILRTLINVDTVLRTFPCPRPLSTFEFYDWALYASMLNSVGMTIQTKQKTFFSTARAALASVQLELY